MSKSFVEVQSNWLRGALSKALENIKTFAAKRDAAIKSQVLTKGRQFLRVRFAAWRGKPMTDEQVIKLFWSGDYWFYYSPPPDYDYTDDAVVFRTLLVAAGAGPTVFVAANELADLNWWCDRKEN